MPLNCNAGEDSWKSLGQSPEEMKPVNLKGDQLWIFTGRNIAEAPVLWSSDLNRRLTGKVPDAGKDWGQKEKRVSEEEMAGRHHWWNEHDLGQTSGDGEGQGGPVCCSPCSCRESDTPGQLNNKNLQQPFLSETPLKYDVQVAGCRHHT